MAMVVDCGFLSMLGEFGLQPPQGLSLLPAEEQALADASFQPQLEHDAEVSSDIEPVADFEVQSGGCPLPVHLKHDQHASNCTSAFTPEVARQAEKLACEVELVAYYDSTMPALKGEQLAQARDAADHSRHCQCADSFATCSQDDDRVASGAACADADTVPGLLGSELSVQDAFSAVSANLVVATLLWHWPYVYSLPWRLLQFCCATAVRYLLAWVLGLTPAAFSASQPPAHESSRAEFGASTSGQGLTGADQNMSFWVEASNASDYDFSNQQTWLAVLGWAGFVCLIVAYAAMWARPRAKDRWLYDVG